MNRFGPPWRLLFLAGTFVTLLAIVILLRSGGFGSIPLPSGSGAIVGVSSSAGQPGTPVRLRIPRLDIDIPVRAVGLTAEGNMGIPSGAWEAGWFKLGVPPGRKGNAVISAHLDTVLGTRAAFWDLRKLQPGDTIRVLDDQGKERVFAVQHALTYDADKAPLAQIFGPAIEANLQLITCDGAWQKDERSYDKRLVVFTRLVDDGGTPIDHLDENADSSPDRS